MCVSNVPRPLKLRSWIKRTFYSFAIRAHLQWFTSDIVQVDHSSWGRDQSQHIKQGQKTYSHIEITGQQP